MEFYRQALNYYDILLNGGMSVQTGGADPFWAGILNLGGWLMVALLAASCLSLLMARFIIAVTHTQARGHGPHPYET